ncbi:MAG: glycosyltransferase [Bacteroidota bacterium]|nr:glycosyltransferase [Bacteroidota bacterium]
MKRIYLTVTNDLTYDQRMNRVCTSLAQAGFEITLVGRKRRTSLPVHNKAFEQHRIRCWFNKGKLFYAEYNIRLFIFLLFKKMDAVCAIDLDTILPCLFISRIKKVTRIYDAHELFTELKEVITRPFIKKIWTRIEKYAVPKFKWGYTVSESIAEEFNKRYGVHYKTIRNVPVLKMLDSWGTSEKFILYHGAVNEARGLENLVAAMEWIDCKIIICGDGNFMKQLKELISEHKMGNKIILKGMLMPDELWKIARQATIGINLVEKKGLNQYYSLSNKFFDYVHAALPQISMNYPEYRKINEEYNVALLINDFLPKTIADAINNLLNNDVLYRQLKANCLKARQELNWQYEEQKLLAFYNSISG